MSSLFTVVVPAYNAARTVEATIRSIQAQTLEDFELIVVDDGSEDDTAELVRAVGDERMRLVQQQNAGLAGARNSGIALASGAYVAFLDSDDLWLPGFLDATATALDADPGAAVAYADAWVLQHETGRIRRTGGMAYQNPPSSTIRDRDALLRRLLRSNFVLSSVAIRSSVLREVEGFRPDLRRSEDYELWLRIVVAGHHLVQVPGRPWVRREIGGSLSDNLLAMFTSGERVYDLVATTYPLDDDLRRLALERRDHYSRLRATVENPAARTLRERAVGIARAAKRRLDQRRLWLAEPPAEVAALLEAVDDPSRRVS